MLPEAAAAAENVIYTNYIFILPQANQLRNTKLKGGGASWQAWIGNEAYSRG